MKSIKIPGEASEQCINYEEMSLFFGEKIFRHVKDAIKTSTKIANKGKMRSYLEILEDISGSKRKIICFP